MQMRREEAKVTARSRSIKEIEIEIPQTVLDEMIEGQLNGWEINLTLVGMRFVKLTPSQTHRLTYAPKEPDPFN
jgi:hypothetical protein